MAESPHVSLEGESLPVLDSVPVVASEMDPTTGFLSARSSWRTLPNTNTDDGALRRAVPLNKTKSVVFAFAKDSVQHSSFDDYRHSVITNRPDINFNKSSTRKETRDEDNTSASEAILPTDVAPEARDSSDDMDEGIVSLTGTMDPNNTAFLTLQEESIVVLQILKQYHSDPPEEGTEVILPTNERDPDPSDMQEGNVSLEGTTEHNDTSFTTLQEESSVDFQIPFHYHRDPTEISLPTDVRNPSDMPEGNTSFNGTPEPNDASFPTLQEESGAEFQIPFYYHRDQPEDQAQSPFPEENSSNSVSETNVSEKANSKVEVSVEGSVDETYQASRNDEKEIDEGSSDHLDHPEGKALSTQTSNDEKCKDIVTSNSGEISISNSISTSKNSIEDSSRQNASAQEVVVNSTIEEKEERIYTSTECRHDPELRLVAVVSMQRGEDEAERQQEEVSDDNPLSATCNGYEIVDPEEPLISKNSNEMERSHHDDQIATVESATRKKATVDATSDFAGMDCPLLTPQLSTCSSLSGSNKNKDEKPEICQDNATSTSRPLPKPTIIQTDEELESNGEDDESEAESSAGLESYYTYDSYSWDDDARKMHKPVDIEQSRFESKYQWAETMFCGSLDSVTCDDGPKVINTLANQANDFVPKHFTSIFQEDDMSLAAQSSKGGSRDDRARVVSSDIDVKTSLANQRAIDHDIDVKASASTCSDMGRRPMYVHAISTAHSDMTEPTVSTFSGTSLTGRDSLNQLSEKAMSLLPLKLRSTGKSAEEIKTQIWNSLTASFEKQHQHTGKSAEEIKSQIWNSLTATFEKLQDTGKSAEEIKSQIWNSLTASFEKQQLTGKSAEELKSQIWNAITKSFEYVPTASFEKLRHSRSVPQEQSQEDQTLYQIWNQMTASMELPVQGQTQVDQKQERPNPLPKEVIEEDIHDAEDYEFLPLSPTGCTSKTSSLAPIEQPHDGNIDKQRGDVSLGTTIKTSSQDENEGTRQGDYSTVSFSVVNDQVKPSMITPSMVGNTMASLLDMWGKLGISLNSYLAMIPSQVGKNDIAVQTSPLPTPISAGHCLPTLTSFRPLPVKENTPSIGGRPVYMSTTSSTSSSTTPISSKAASMVAAPVQKLGQVHLISSAASHSGAFDAVQPTGQSDDIQKGNEDIEMSDFTVTRCNESAAPAYCERQSLHPPTGLEVLLLSMSLSNEDNKRQALASPLENRTFDGSRQDQKVQPQDHVEHIGNKPVTLTKAKNRLGRFGGIGRSLAKGARRTFGRAKKPARGSTATLHHYTKS